jgi:hypothetical protein
VEGFGFRLGECHGGKSENYELQKQKIFLSWIMLSVI